MQLPPILKDRWSAYAAAPPWRRWGLVCILVGLGIYLAWSKFWPKPPAAGSVVSVSTAHDVANMQRKAVTPRKLMVLTPKAEVVKRLDLPPEQATNDDEEVLEAVDVPPAKYGATSTTFVNMTTGKHRTIVKLNEAPWLAFRRDNTFALGAGYGPNGQIYAARYRRDVLQVKEVYLVGEVEANWVPARQQQFEGKAMGWVEYRRW